MYFNVGYILKSRKNIDYTDCNSSVIAKINEQ